MPLAVSATTFSGRSAADVDEGAHVVGEGAEQVERLEPAGGAVVRRARPSAVIALISTRPVSSPIGRAPGQAELHAVVLRGVVRGREHRARRVEPAGREVHEVGGREAEVDDVDALGAHAVGERGGELDARGPHVAPDQHLAGPADLAGDEHREGLPEGRATSASS